MSNVVFLDDYRKKRIKSSIYYGNFNLNLEDILKPIGYDLKSNNLSFNWLDSLQHYEPENKSD